MFISFEFVYIYIYKFKHTFFWTLFPFKPVLHAENLKDNTKQLSKRTEQCMASFFSRYYYCMLLLTVVLFLNASFIAICWCYYSIVFWNHREKETLHQTNSWFFFLLHFYFDFFFASSAKIERNIKYTHHPILFVFFFVLVYGRYCYFILFLPLWSVGCSLKCCPFFSHYYSIHIQTIMCECVYLYAYARAKRIYFLFAFLSILSRQCAPS